MNNFNIHKYIPTAALLISFISVCACPIDTIKNLNGPITEIHNFPQGIHGMALDENGVLYFADTYSKMDLASKIYMLSPPYTGTPMETGIESKSIAGLMWHNGYLYVAFLVKNQVRIYDKNLEFQMSYEIESPWNFTAHGKEILVLDYFGTVSHLSRRGRVTKFIENLKNPFDIQYNGDKALWISEQVSPDENGHVLLYNYRGEIIDSVHHTFSNPEGLAMDDFGNLYISDTGAGEIIRMSPSGKITVLTDRYKLPICVDINMDGTIFVNSDDKDGMLLMIKNRR